MFDVLPPNPSGGNSAYTGSPKPASPAGGSARPRRPMASVTPPSQTDVPARPTTVSLSWKLPARLRKPIREQLSKERQQKKARDAIIRFKRRPLTTQSVLQPPSTRQQNVGAEHHTGDVYKAARPKIRVALPPYMGGITRIFSGPSQKRSPGVSSGGMIARPKQARVVSATAKPIRAPQARVVRPVTHISPKLPARSSTPAQPVFELPSATARYSPFPITERDTSYQWQNESVAVEVEEEFMPHVDLVSEDARAEIKVPKRRFALPFSLSFWPKSLLTSKKKFQKPRVARRTRGQGGVMANAVVLVGGFLIIMGLVWNLQGVGRGVAVLGQVQTKTQAGYTKLLSAQAAFATTDFSQDEADLSQAHDLLAEARGDIRTALAAAQHVLSVIDVTGTVRSGDQLLLAGEELALAGQYIAKGAGAFFDVEVFAQPEESQETTTAKTLLEALQVATQEFSSALPSLGKAKVALAKVESPFLPEDIRSEVVTLETAVPKIMTFIEQFLQQSDTLAQLLGARQSRQYLLLFANYDELRPVGGFIGSIGLVNVDRGQVENIDVDSVYDPDGQLKEFIAPPDPLLPITSRWFMRDANWFVDYEKSAKKVAQFFEKEGGPTVDGVILLTPEVIKKMLTITGPIVVPGYNVVLTAENFQAVTQDQVTYSYDREANKPKQFMADVTPILLNKLLGEGAADSHVYAPVMQALSQAARTKDLLLYFREEELQNKVRQAGWSGQVPQNIPGFLYVNNANIGGHKSDQFIEQEIDYRVEVDEVGEAAAVVTIRRTHHGPEEAGTYKYPDGEDPSQKNNVVWQRVLVPQGSHLLEAKGYTPASQVGKVSLPQDGAQFQLDPEVAAWQQSIHQLEDGTLVGSESDYTFFGNWILTKPGQTTVTLYRYTLPQPIELPSILSPAKAVTVSIFKQPGDRRTMVRTSLKMPADASIVHAVPQQGVTFEEPGELVYRGALKSDIVVGGVFERK